MARQLSLRLVRLFMPDADGNRPCNGGDARYAADPHWKDLVLFNEYFDGDNGRGCGASHQTGWTALVARILHGLTPGGSSGADTTTAEQLAEALTAAVPIPVAKPLAASPSAVAAPGLTAGPAYDRPMRPLPRRCALAAALLLGGCASGSSLDSAFDQAARAPADPQQPIVGAWAGRWTNDDGSAGGPARVVVTAGGTGDAPGTRADRLTMDLTGFTDPGVAQRFTARGGRRPPHGPGP